MIATTLRGSVEPFEPLAPADQWAAAARELVDEAADRDTCRDRATAAYRFERDPVPSDAEILKLKRKHPEFSEQSMSHVDRMVRLSGGRL